MELRIPTIHESLTDGVPTFRVETPKPHTAILAFRVGHYDENLHNRGITHLVEHVALHSLRKAEFKFNGSVSGDMLLFWASGTDSQIASFLSELCQRLRSLPVERLETEAGVLKAEILQRGAHHAEVMLGMLFGPNGPGMLAYPERGFDLVGPAEAQAWVDHHCTRQNAVLMLAGPSPLDLSLDLGTGAHRPFRIPGPDVGYRPRRMEAISEQDRGICLAGLTPRTSAAALGWEVLAERLTERLRHELGLVYNIGSNYLPLDADTAFAFAGVDAPDESRLIDTASEFLSVVEKLRDRGPEPEELSRLVERYEAAFTSDELALARSELQRVGYNRLLGLAPKELGALLRERRETTPDEVNEALRPIVDRASVIAPSPWILEIPAREKRAYRPVRGSLFRPRGKPPGDLRKVIVGQDGISGETSTRWVTIRWEDVVAVDRPTLFHWAVHSRTGAYLLISTDNYWRRRTLSRALERHLPPGVMIPHERRD